MDANSFQSEALAHEKEGKEIRWTRATAGHTAESHPSNSIPREKRPLSVHVTSDLSNAESALAGFSDILRRSTNTCIGGPLPPKAFLLLSHPLLSTSEISHIRQVIFKMTENFAIRNQSISGRKKSVAEEPVTSVLGAGEIPVYSERELTADEEVLAALGYKPEFKREFSLWTTFCVSFAVLGLLPSFASTLYYVRVTGDMSGGQSAE